MPSPPLAPPLVASDTRGHYFEADGRAPPLLVGSKGRFVILAGRRPRILCVTNPLGVGAVHYQGGGSRGVRRGEERGHRPTLGDAEQGSPRRARGLQHGADVIHSLLQSRKSVLGDAIRQPGATLVEGDQSTEGGEPF